MTITKCPIQLKISHFLASWRSFLSIAVKCTVYEKKQSQIALKYGDDFSPFLASKPF